MLQSPSKRIQRHRRLTSVSESPILNAKQDTKRQQQSKQRQQPSETTPYPSPSRGYQRRRQHSVPDALTPGSATAPSPRKSDASAYPARTLNTFGLEGSGDHEQHLDNDIFLASELQRPKTPPSQTNLSRSPVEYQSWNITRLQKMELEFTPVTPQSPFRSYQPTQQNASQLIDELLSEVGSPVALARRRGSMISNSSPLRATFQPGAQDSELPTPPHTARLHSVSTFDLAPLPHPNFVSISAISNMGSESDFDNESYYSPISSAMSPPSSSVPSSPTTMHAELFRDPLATVPENPTPSDLQSMDLPVLAPAPRPTPNTPSPIRVRAPPPSLSLGTKTTGITSEEISNYISGPDSTDGKWLCLYPECNKRFGRKENIKSHVQTHLGDRQYRCHVCKKCFVRQHDLKRHSKIHTGVKPYPCLCGNSFARHDALTRHRQRGMCIGAFDGIIKKVVKRGRPRKKPLLEDDLKVKPEEGADSPDSESYFGSDASNPQTPRDLPEFSSSSPAPQSPGPETPRYDEGTPSLRESSPPIHQDSSSYSPPTSPSDEFDFEAFVSPPSGRSSLGFNSLVDGDFIQSHPSTEHPPSRGKFSSSFGCSDDFSSSQNQEEFELFSQESMEILGLTALERDPNILNFEDIYIKPEFLSHSQDSYFGGMLK
ncbi:Metallothionein expression activator [Maublancomyces gigas]|uniref:Metallothionein expression activator n=1 Tax=Discina gigas TaxID=1032678 RepID=A0ABR3GF64_9PEZI